MTQEPLPMEPADANAIEFRPDMFVVSDIDPADPANAGHVSLFGDDSWCLHPASGKPTDRSRANFTNVPPQFRMTLKRLVWVALNLDTPIERLERSTTGPKRIKPGSVKACMQLWRMFVRWLAGQGINSLGEVDDDVLYAYAEHLAALTLKPATKRRRRQALTRMWLLAPYLPLEDRLGMPPWEASDAEDAIDDLFGPDEPYIENTTEPIHPQTMAGFLVWCIGLVNCGDDILRAVERRTALTAKVRRHHQPGDLERWRQYLGGLRRDGGAVPGWTMSGGRTGIAGEYLSAQLGISTLTTANNRPIDIPTRVGAPLDIAIEGRIGGEPWVDAIDFYEVDVWVRRLATACLVVIDYLSGMRPDECLNLRRGCCHQSDPGDALSGFEVRGRIFKRRGPGGSNGRDDQGRAHTWYVIEPVAKAVEMMERLHGHDLLFPVAAFGIHSGRSGDRSALTSHVNVNIRELIGWCNGAAGGPGRPLIPPDPKEAVMFIRFRRTIAWFVYRLPRGLIALGYQYGHINLGQTARYGNRIRSGLSEVMEEHAFALRDHIEDAAAALEAGEGVSGPSSERYAGGVMECRRTFRGRVLTRRGAKDFLENPAFRIYDNSGQFAACCYDGMQALCREDNERLPGIERSPDLTRCDPACPNIARTDTHMDAIRATIRQLDDEIASPATPQPMRVRLTQGRDKLQAILDAHERNRIVPSRQVL